MRVSIDVSSVRRTTAFEYAIRFLLGGIITAVRINREQIWSSRRRSFPCVPGDSSRERNPG